MDTRAVGGCSFAVEGMAEAFHPCYISMDACSQVAFA